MTSTSSSLESLIQEWDGETVIVRFHRASGSWILIAIHSSRLGPAGGGTRMRAYPRVTAALLDAFRLAEGMTNKFALAGLAMGGAKAVLSVPPDLDRDKRLDLLHEYGDLVGQLRGGFRTGPDIGTGPEDMDVIAERGSPYVFARTEAAGGSGNSAEPTALGVYCGICATLEHLGLGDSPTGRRFAVQGVGGVGSRLAERLLEAGASVTCTDLDSEALDRLRHRFRDSERFATVPPEQIYDARCDVFSPNAVGAVLDESTIPRLRCRAVAGGANNQLATPEDAARIREAGILYAPDYVINSGGAIGVIGMEVHGWSRERSEEQVRGIAETLGSIYRRAEAEGIDTEDAAQRQVRARLESAPPSELLPES